MELIVNNKEDFTLLKKYASYSSETTNVIEIENSFVPYVLENFKDIIQKYSTNIDALDIKKPELLLSNGKMFLKGIDEGLSVYLGLPYSKEVKADSYDKAFELLGNGVIRPSQDVASILTPMNEDSSVDELFCSNFTVNYKHKRVSLKNFPGVSKISDLKFDDRDIVINSYRVYKDIEITEVSQVGKEYIVKGKNKFGQIELRFYFLSYDQKALFRSRKPINVMSNKIYGGKKQRILISPEIVPNSFPDTYIRKELSSNKRDIPVKLLRLAYSEYVYRNR